MALALVAGPLSLVLNVLRHFQLVDTKDNPIGLMGFYAFLILPFASIGIAVLAWIRFVERRPLATIGLGGPHRVKAFLRGHLIGIAMTSVIVAGIWIGNGFEADDFGNAQHSPGALLGIGLLLVGFAVQSSIEEIVFRGWLLSTIAYRFDLVVAAVLSSLLFTLLHVDDLHQPWLFTVNVFLFATFASCWAIKAGNIWVVMGWHAGWNWWLATGFELRLTGLDAHLPALLVRMIPKGKVYLTGGTLGPEGSFVCTCLLAGAVLFLVRGLRPQR